VVKPHHAGSLIEYVGNRAFADHFSLRQQQSCTYPSTLRSIICRLAKDPSELRYLLVATRLRASADELTAVNFLGKASSCSHYYAEPSTQYKDHLDGITVNFQFKRSQTAVAHSLRSRSAPGAYRHATYDKAYESRVLDIGSISQNTTT
jgi:hypothetical protein